MVSQHRTLAAQGALEWAPGGARTLLLRGEEPPFAPRSHEAGAAEVSSLVADGETVLLDRGRRAWRWPACCGTGR